MYSSIPVVSALGASGSTLVTTTCTSGARLALAES
jgi:hypothetical protein